MNGRRMICRNDLEERRGDSSNKKRGGEAVGQAGRQPSIPLPPPTFSYFFVSSSSSSSPLRFRPLPLPPGSGGEAVVALTSFQPGFYCSQSAKKMKKRC